MILGLFYTYRYIAKAKIRHFVIFVCLCVCHKGLPHIPFVHTVLEWHRKFIFYMEVTPYTLLIVE